MSTTSTLVRATTDDRIAMMRAMLVDRFKLSVHVEHREEPVYDLVLARRDGRLGSGMKLLDVDCGAQHLAQRAAAEAVPTQARRRPRPHAGLRRAAPGMHDARRGAALRRRGGNGLDQLGDLLEGETTLDDLATTLFRTGTGRFVVNKTGLSRSSACG